MDMEIIGYGIIWMERDTAYVSFFIYVNGK